MKQKKSVGDYLKVLADDTYEIHLTVKGRRVAEDVYERHDTFRRLLMSLGVDEKTAAADACEMEHAVSPASYEALKMLAEKQKEKV